MSIESKPRTWLDRPSVGEATSATSAVQDLIDRLPKRCGYCRTLMPDLVPRATPGCLECMEEWDHVDWSDIDAIEEVLDGPG